MKPETRYFLKLVAVGLPAIVVIITILTFVLSIADAYYPGGGGALGIGAIIAVFAGMALAIERGWLD